MIEKMIENQTHETPSMGEPHIDFFLDRKKIDSIAKSLINRSGLDVKLTLIPFEQFSDNKKNFYDLMDSCIKYALKSIKKKNTNLVIVCQRFSQVLSYITEKFSLDINFFASHLDRLLTQLVDENPSFIDEHHRKEIKRTKKIHFYLRIRICDSMCSVLEDDSFYCRLIELITFTFNDAHKPYPKNLSLKT